MATTSLDGEPIITLTDRATGVALSAPLVGARSPIADAEFDPTGQWIVATELDGTVRMWNVATRRTIGPPLRTAPGSAARFLAGSGLRMVTTDGDRAVVWTLDASGLIDIACRAAGRNLTAQEWADVGPQDEPFRRTCEW